MRPWDSGFCCEITPGVYLNATMERPESVKLVFQASIKGYHECKFILEPNQDKFVVVRKFGDRGKAFEVLRQSGRKRLWHLQKELVPILWAVSRSASMTG